MRINSRNWPVVVAVAAVVWLVALGVFWAGRSLSDRVPTTVAHQFTPGEVVVESARDAGPVLTITCGSPLDRRAVDPDDLPRLDQVVDGSGNLLPDVRLSRDPCTSFHRQSRGLLVANVVLSAGALSAMVAVLARRRRARRPLGIVAA